MELNTNTNKAPVFALELSDNPDKTYVDVISLLEDDVADPAIMIDWITFQNQQPIDVKLKIESDEKRRVMTPVLIPNQYIKRYNTPNNEGRLPINGLEANAEYYISISKQNIEKGLQRFQRLHNVKNNFNLNHNPNDVVSNEKINVFEIWLTRKNDVMSKEFGFNVPEGTWMVILQVFCDKLWQRIKAGDITAISMEGMFNYGAVIDEVNIQQSKSNDEDEDSKLLEKLKEILSNKNY